MLGVFFYRVLSSVVSAAFTSGILIFLLAELAPHIVCSGYGFQIAPALTWLAQVCMVLTCPLSCPLGLILDLALRRDISTCGIRERAMEMIRTSVNDPYRLARGCGVSESPGSDARRVPFLQRVCEGGVQPRNAAHQDGGRHPDAAEGLLHAAQLGRPGLLHHV